MRALGLWSVVLAMSCSTSCLHPRLGDDADLRPLAVEWLSLGELQPVAIPSVEPEHEVRVLFSEPVDPFSLSGDTVMVVGAEAQGPCGGHPDCPDGLCVEGRCFSAPVDAAFQVDANRPPLAASRRSRVIPSSVWMTADGREVRLRPHAPLTGAARYALVLSAALRDRKGNPLVSDEGRVKGVVYDFVTGALGGVRPRLLLLAPAPLAEGVPTNLAEVRLAVTGAVEGIGDDGLWLEGPEGRVPGLVSALPEGCPDPYPACYEIALGADLQPLAAYRLGHHEGLRDDEGRPLPASSEVMFVTGRGADASPPVVTELAYEGEGGCLEVSLVTDEAARVTLRWWSSAGAGELALAGTGTAHRGALPLVPLPESLAVDAWDVVGNLGTYGPEPLSLTPLAAVAISEVLANPAGPEPAQEFVEIVNQGDAPVSLEGWWITDTLSKPGDPLPPEVLSPGAVGLVVPSTYQAVGLSDPAPAAQTHLLKLSGSTIGSGGLTNSGEPVFLLDSEGRVVSRYPGGAASGELPANGQSVGRELGAGCAGRGAWRLQPEGSSTPGRLE